MSEKRKIQRFNLDEGRVWEVIEGLSPFKTTYTLEEVCEKLNDQQSTIERLEGKLELKTEEVEHLNFVADLNLKIGQSVLINLLNNYEIENNKLTQKIKDKNEYQRTLEAKIRRLKDRIKVLEKNE